MPVTEPTSASTAEAEILREAGFPPERIARIKAGAPIVRALRAVQTAQHDAGEWLPDELAPGVLDAVTAARLSLVEALRRCDRRADR